MKLTHYQPQQLATLLETLRSQKISGTLSINAQSNPARSCILVWRKGEITFGGSSVPDSQEFVQKIGQKLKPDLINVAFNLAKQKATNPNSVRELLETLVKMHLFSWEQVKSLVQAQTIQVLEPMLPDAGQLQLDPAVQFDICYDVTGCGLDWSSLMSEVNRRQQQWTALASIIPSRDAVPQLRENALTKMTDLKARQHLQKWVDGERSLGDIAQNLNKDPLQIAKTYFNWAQLGWVDFSDNTTAAPTIEPENLATILSVDDSPIVQTTIKRALGDRYNLLCVDNALDALSLLREQTVDLLLLDVTMPGIDGLEMCRSVRNMPKLRGLPIVMLTARDKQVDILQGQIAGTTQYLTKPFDAEKLLEVARRYITKNIPTAK